MSIQEQGPNAEQIAYWNDEAGRKWVALQERLDAGIEPIGLEAIQRARTARGERVIDVGCGCGQSTLELARRVGSEGSVLGIDIATAMLARARERAAEAGLSQAHFENDDAQQRAFAPGAADLVFSRFGVMFFADPVAAFANLRRATRAGGRLVCLCWQGIDRNPWMLEPLKAVVSHVGLPSPPPPGAPGPFAFADPVRTLRILHESGWTRGGYEPLEREFLVGGEGTLDDAVEFALQIGPVGAALRQTTRPVDLPAIRASVRTALAPWFRDHGVRMPCTPALLTAVN